MSFNIPFLNIGNALCLIEKFQFKTKGNKNIDSQQQYFFQILNMVPLCIKIKKQLQKFVLILFINICQWY